LEFVGRNQRDILGRADLLVVCVGEEIPFHI
jgi:hypothetical protein